MKLLSVFILLAFQITFAQTKNPIVPDPFCAPKEFFKYLEHGNVDRVNYVIDKCANIDLNEADESGNYLINSVIKNKWQDIFDKIKNRKDISFQSPKAPTKQTRIVRPLDLLIMYDRQEWFTEVLKIRGEIDINLPPYIINVTKNEKLPIAYLEAVLSHPKVEVNAKENDLNALEISIELGRFEHFERLMKDTQTDKSRIWEIACSAQQVPGARAIFLAMVKSGQYDVNRSCGKRHALAEALANSQSTEIAQAIISSQKLNLSSAGVTTSVVEAAFLRLYGNGGINENYFKFLQSIVNHPTFKWDDKNASKKNLWHILAQFAGFLEGRALPLFSKLTNTGINDLDYQNKSPLMIAAYSSREIKKDDTQSTHVFLKISRDPATQINLQANGYSAMLNAVSYFSSASSSWSTRHTIVSELWARGADINQIGDINVKGTYNRNPLHLSLDLLAQVGSDGPEYQIYQWLLTSKTIDLNFEASGVDSNTRPAIHRVFKLLYSNRPGIIKIVREFLNDPRFNKDQISKIQTVDGKYCTPLFLATSTRAIDIADLVLSKTPEKIQSVTCKFDGGYDGAFNPLEFAVKLGSADIVELYLTKSKIPVGRSFVMAIDKGNLPIAKLFLKTGYTKEVNYQNGQFLILAAENNDLDTVKALLKLQNIDPNAKLKSREESLLYWAAKNNQTELFDLLFAHPKTQVSSALVSLSGGIKPENLAFFERMFSKFQIITADDQEAAHMMAQHIAYGDGPVATFMSVVKKPKFDVNYLAKGNLNYNEFEQTLLAYLAKTDRVDILKEYIKTKNLDYSKGYPILFNLFLGSYDSNKEMFELYAKQPQMKAELPSSEGRSLIESIIALRDNYSNYRAEKLILLLSHSKFVISKTDQALVYDAAVKRPYSDINIDLLDAAFSHKSFQPVAQWSQFLIDLGRFTDKERAFVIKWAGQLDLNVSKDGRPFINNVINNDEKELFDFLLTQKSLKFENVLRYAGKPHKDYYFNQIIEKRIQDISQNELLVTLNEFVGSSESFDEGKLKVVIKLSQHIKSFNGLRKLQGDYRGAYEWIIKWAPETLALRVLKEDKSMEATKLGEALAAAVLREHIGFIDMILAKGVQIDAAIDYDSRFREWISALSLATSIKSLKVMDHLLKKGASVQGYANNSYSRLTSFGVAVKIGWIEGAEFLRSNGANVNFTGSGESSIAITVHRKDAEFLKYLLSVGADANSNGPLVSAIDQQNDVLVGLLMQYPSLDPNQRGYDETRERVSVPLVEAARWGRKDYVLELLKNPKTDKQATDSLGYRAIDWAATNGFSEIVEILKR
ncbi:MAG: ankyrin repeat domain-containing protein [Bdellovibrionaceae bacterium]|nr:ankyrin repeat domain-containing protein [Pseudobdellovibrionaceae bacterium]